MNEATRASVCLAAVGVTSGIILAIAALSAGSAYQSELKILTVLLGLVTLLLGAAAAFFTYVARDQGRVGRWQTCRGEAEMERLAVFGAIAAKAADEGSAVALHGLALVSVHLLDDQRKWLTARALRHRKSSETTSLLGGVAHSLAFVGGSGAIFAGQASGAVFIVLAGVVGAAIGAFASNRDALRRDRANAERYENAEVALDELAGRTRRCGGEDRRRRAESLGRLHRCGVRSALDGAQAMARGDRPGRGFAAKAGRAIGAAVKAAETNAGSAGNAWNTGRIGPALESAGFKQAVDF